MSLHKSEYPSARFTSHSFVLFSIVLLSSVVLLVGCSTKTNYLHSEIGETGEFYDSQDENSFEAFCMELFKQEMKECSTLDLHYTLLDPKAYGIEPGEATLGTYRLQDMIENHGELEHLKEQLQEYERDNLTKR